MDLILYRSSQAGQGAAASGEEDEHSSNSSNSSNTEMAFTNPMLLDGGKFNDTHLPRETDVSSRYLGYSEG